MCPDRGQKAEVLASQSDISFGSHSRHCSTDRQEGGVPLPPSLPIPRLQGMPVETIRLFARRGWARTRHFRELMYHSVMTNRIFKAGESREQPSLLPPRLEDYVGPDNPVRAIESFVCALDLAKLGFRHADRGVEVGQPPYDPADLLKLYLYGYINQIRSSRRLERKAFRDLELIWLLRNVKPGYRTIANFRKENWKALKAVNRSFVLLVRELGLVGGSVVAIDGSFFHGDASKASIFTRKRLAEQIAKLDHEIEAYGKSLEDNDAAEAKEPRKDRTDDNSDGGGGDGGDLGAKVSALMAKRSRAQADLARLDASGETQMSLTDPDARLLSKNGQTVAGYNVQAVVDDKHKLIVASEVVNDSSDVNQLHAMAKATKEVLEAKSLQVLADAGYYSSADLKACEDDGIEAYVPASEGNGMLEKQQTGAAHHSLRCLRRVIIPILCRRRRSLLRVVEQPSVQLPYRAELL